MRGDSEVFTRFPDHRERLCRELDAALRAWAREGVGAGGVVFDAGPRAAYFRDDIDLPFRACPHFARWVPDPAPGDLLCVRPGADPRWLRVVERDYWHEPRPDLEHPARDLYRIEEHPSREHALRALGDVADCAYVGSDLATAEWLGIPERAREPAPLLAELCWNRAYKTPYEVACIRAAAETAGRGHRAARAAAAQGASEYGAHLRYLEAAELLDVDTPYPSIVAWDDRAAILHYQRRRRVSPQPGKVFLLDAGARAWGYCSDITRTYAFDPPDEFAALLQGMQQLQQALVEQVKPGQSFVDLHGRALRGVGELLVESGVLRGSVDEACERGRIDAFLPHGLGHHLGIQVHDAGGRLASPRGEVRAPPARWPYLRTTRDLEPGHVVTIEPGLYFVPTLLASLRAADPGACDWSRVGALAPCGGIRIEDDIWVSADGPCNLSRPLVDEASHEEPPSSSSSV